MKKIFKYGCGCLGIIFGLIVLLIIFAHCDSSSDSPKQQSVNQNNDFIELFDGVDSEIDSQLKWNKKGSRKFLQESATTHVENYLEQNDRNVSGVYCEIPDRVSIVVLQKRKNCN